MKSLWPYLTTVAAAMSGLVVHLLKPKTWQNARVDAATGDPTSLLGILYRTITYRLDKRDTFARLKGTSSLIAKLDDFESRHPQHTDVARAVAQSYYDRAIPALPGRGVADSPAPPGEHPPRRGSKYPPPHRPRRSRWIRPRR